MPSRTFIIEGEFTSLNEYTNSERANKYIAATMKREETEAVQYSVADSLPLPDDCYPLAPHFDFYVKDLRKDADNIGFAVKFILDGFVKAGVLPDDRRKFIVGYSVMTYVDKSYPRVEISYKW